jgi:hypothetical protein
MTLKIAYKKQFFSSLQRHEKSKATFTYKSTQAAALRQLYEIIYFYGYNFPFSRAQPFFLRPFRNVGKRLSFLLYPSAT